MKKSMSLLSLALVSTILMTSCEDSYSNSDKSNNNSNMKHFQTFGSLYEKNDLKLTTEEAQKYACTIGTGGRDIAAGLRTDGTVVVAGDHEKKCDVSDWSNIKAISVGGGHIVGLRTNGTVVATGSNNSGQCDVSGWHDIIAIAAGSTCTIGLKSDGTVVAVGENWCDMCEVSDWKDIVAIATDYSETMGLRSDGTVVSTHYDDERYSDWEDIVAITVGFECVGLKSDGTLRIGKKGNTILFPNEKELADWNDIVYVNARYDKLAGLRSDGTVIVESYYGDNFGEERVENWEDIVAVDVGEYFSIGLKSDGTVVATGEEDMVNEISKWENIGIPSFDTEDNKNRTINVTSIGSDVDIHSLDTSVVPKDAYYKIKSDYLMYDENGELTESLDCIIYNDRNNEFLMSILNENGTEVVGGRASYNYDEAGNLLSKNILWYNNPIDSPCYYTLETYVYGKNGVPIINRLYDKDGNLEYELTSVVDDENRPVSSVAHSLKGSGSSDDSYATIEYSDLDEYGNYTKKVEADPDNEQIITTKYVYNSDGNITREERITEYTDKAYNGVIAERTQETEYDENGNITKESTFAGVDYDRDGKVESESDHANKSVREYMYYPDSMSYIITTYDNGVLRSVETYDYDSLMS